MILYILIGLALASFVIAFFSARTWHWAYVLVVEAIFLATIGFLLLAAETVRINSVLRKQVNDLQKQLDTVQAQNEALRHGTNNATVISQLIAEPPPLKVAENTDSIPSIADLDR